MPYNNFTSNPTFSGKTADPPEASRNNTDVIAPNVKLYIEGVQVPFESISVSQAYQQKPTADIQVPPESGLLDIIRGYEPKVHIFYEDQNYGGDRLLFWGHIKSLTYSRSRSQGSSFITYHCEHKNELVKQVTLDYTGWASPANENRVDPSNNQAAIKPSSTNSTLMIINALSGISGVATTDQRLVSNNSKVADAPVDKLDPDLAKFEERLIGMPGVVLNLWAQLKKTCMVDPNANLLMTKMFIPLLEEGLGYFKRMSGHSYLEKQLQTDKQPYCHGRDSQETKILVPPCFRNQIASAVQREITARHLSNLISFSGELTDFETLIRYFMNGVQYEVLTLASPAEINLKPSVYVDAVNSTSVEKCTVETIIKPQLPQYYSPTCNVFLPRMYHSIQVGQDESMTPTRIAATHDAMPGTTGPEALGTSFRAPASVREAVAYNALLKGVSGVSDLNLGATKAYAFSIPGKYEQGVGVRPQRIALPWWLSILSSDKAAQGAQGNQEKGPDKGTDDYNDMLVLSAEWRSRYGTKVVQNDGTITSTPDPTKNNLNPFDVGNKSVLPHERLLYSTIDHEFSQKVISSRSGFLESVFNPYAIPGYPMDIIDDSPNHPSFHALMVSVTHTITSRSISTSVSFVGAVTYAELSNYYTQPVSPFLQTALNIVNGEVDQAKYDSAAYGDPSPYSKTASTLIQNPVAKAAADEFYREVLGVGAAAPDDLIHFSSGRAFPVDRKAGILVPRLLPGTDAFPDVKAHGHKDREPDDFYSTVGNIRMVSRPVESKDSIKSKFGYNFIDLDPKLYNASYMNYANPKLASNLYLEPGASLFLDYLSTDEFIKK